MKGTPSFIKKVFIAIVLFLLVSNIARAEKKPIEFRFAANLTIASLDPMVAMNNWVEHMADTNIYDTLIYPDEEKGYIPWVAESWDISQDGRTYTFNLRKGVFFHDGTEITAEDVAFSMDRMQKLGGPMAPYLKSVAPGTAKALGKYTVRFNALKRDPSIMQALFLFKVMNKKLVLQNKQEGKYGEFGDYGQKFLQNHDAGSGPYMVVEYKTGDYLKMKRFEQYSLTKWKPNSVDVATIYVIPEVVTIATKMKKGELDMATPFLPPMIMADLKKDKGFVVDRSPLPEPWVLIMNNKKKPLDDPYVRRAIAHAYDTKTVMEEIVGMGKALRGPLPEEMSGGCKDIVTYPFDLGKAKEMLKRSKYSEDELRKMTLEIASSLGNETFKKIALLTVSNLKKIGINATVEIARFPDICQRERSPETAYHMVVYYVPPFVPHPDRWLLLYTHENWGVASPSGGIYYENPAVTEAIIKGDSASKMDEQKQYYCQAQKQIAMDSPVVFSHSTVRDLPFWRYLKGYKLEVGSADFDLRIDRYTMDTEDPLFKKNQGW